MSEMPEVPQREELVRVTGLASAMCDVSSASCTNFFRSAVQLPWAHAELLLESVCRRDRVVHNSHSSSNQPSVER